MARKLSEEERNTITYLTSELCSALPAHLRGHAGTIASSLVRIPRPQVTMRDINRIVGRIGEHKEELRAAIREYALTRVEAPEGEPEAFVLRMPEPGEAAEVPAVGEDSGESDAGQTAAEQGAADRGADGDAGTVAPSEVAAADAPAKDGATPESNPAPASAAEKPKPTRRRRRRVGDRAGMKAGAPQAEPSSEDASKAVDADEALPASGPATAGSADELVEVPVPDAQPAATEAPAAEKPRRRTRRSHRKAATKSEASASDSANDQQVAAGAATAPESVPASVAAPSEQEAVSVNEAGKAAAAQVASTPDQPAPVQEPTSAQEPAAEPRPPVAALPAPAENAPAPKPANGRGGNRGGRNQRRGNGSRRGQSGNGSGDGASLSEVPYVRRGGEAEAELRQRIVALDQRFWMNGWLLSHPGAFALYEKELTALNDFLANGTLVGELTRRQLAYQMGGDEKFFEYGSDGFKLLRAMGVEDLIRHRPMPKADLLYHAPRRRKHMRVLVTENLDPWLDVRDLMYEDGRSQILGERIHAVVLGGGMPVLETNRLHLLLDTLGADSYEVLYWGDIDRAGFDIFLKLQALLEGKFEVKPFVPAYQLMCDRAMERFPDPKDNEKTGQVNIEVPDPSPVLEGLTPEAADYARAVVENCSLVPQEILTKRDL